MSSTLRVWHPSSRAIPPQRSWNRPELEELLSELNREGKIAEENNHYRLTYNGTESIIPGKGRTIRDIHRMEYLVEYSKQRGAD